MKKLAIVLLVASLTVPAFAQEVLPRKSAVEVDPDVRIAATAELYSRLSSFETSEAAAMEIQIPTSKLAALSSHEPTGGPLWVGVKGDVGFAFNPALKSQTLGSVLYADGNMVWSGTFRSPGATGVRLHLEDVDLPRGTEIYVFDRYEQAFGPYSAGKGGNLWTNTVKGDEIVLQVHLPLSATFSLQGRDLFRVSEISHLGDNYSFGFSINKSFCSWNDSCITNAECESIPGSVQPLQDGVAYLLYDLPGGTYLCTGGLLNDTGSTGTPYLLTANHCFSNESAADSLEAYFQWTVGCGASCGSQYFPPGSVPRTVGADLLATSSTTDFTLVQLDQAAPSGSTFLGWTTAAVANSSGTNLYRVSHPSGSPQAYSEQDVNTSAGTCGGLPRGNFIYSDATLGDTEGGSSGSPVVNGSGQVVGQLYGACGATPATSCDGDDRTVDGAFAVTFPSIAEWLDPGSGPSCLSAGESCTVNSDCCSNRCRGRRNRKTCRGN
ncbi:MAG: trypsin-like peptidase domain-containing protein [bacterium]|nr:trypsin-like peptidase domain-containing protein [bacterium]